MVFQRDKGAPSDSFDTGLPPAQSGEDVPRWLVILGLVAGLTLLVALLRYAIDLLGVVFVIILVGFAIRALSDWLTEGEAVSGWAVSALSLGLTGTVLVGLWLFNSRDIASETLQNRLPGPVQRTVAWLEREGWGQRVLLPGRSASGPLAGDPGGGALRSGGGAVATEAADPGEPVVMAPQRAVPSLPGSGALADVTRSRTARAPRGAAAGEAEASPASRPAATADPAQAVPTPPVLATSVTLSSSPARPVVGRSVRLTAEVRAHRGESVPAGSVVFSADEVVLGRAAVRNGTAVLVTLNLAIGDHILSATYEGDDAYLPSRSAGISLAVARK
jgi:hypothetical protein